jgi:hypothetical protein
MEMRQDVELRLTHHEQVHQLAVIRHERVVAARRDRRAAPAWIANAQRERSPIAVRGD